MPNVNRLYVQTLDQPLPPQDQGQELHRKTERLEQLIDQADAVVVGIGSGVSTSAGYDFYHPNEQFHQQFAPFEQAHGFDTLFDGLYHVFGSNEEAWPFFAAVASYVRRLPLGHVYAQLADVLSAKRHFVITTNADGQATRAFGEDHVWEFQGNLSYVQCSQPCNDHVEDFLAQADDIVAQTRIVDGVPRIPYDLLPRCQECNHLMAPWVRDTNFCESDTWKTSRDAFNGFVRGHLGAGERVLFLEMGVSSMTPAIIKLPFWNMVQNNSHAFYVDVNVGDASTPAQLGERALTITADATRVVDLLRA